jgi:rfaE bifunctional protein kinase chain/domain
VDRARFQSITARYPSLRVAVIGDICLDRYLEIDPAKNEISIETGLPVYNVTNVRSQPGAAGTILNNLVALGIEQIFAVGFCGDDGEGYELRQALQARRGVRLEHFVLTGERRTFTYAKPLLTEAGKSPVELNRLDMKNWTPTPMAVSARLEQATRELAGSMDAFILMDQVDIAGTGVVTSKLLQAVDCIARERPEFLILADSRRGLRGFPNVTFKMNAAELARFLGRPTTHALEEIQQHAASLAKERGQHVFVTMAEQGIVGAAPSGEVQHIPALPVRSEIDIVGAGDAVTANLTAALSAGASLREALEMAMLAASIVIHQLGTTGTASVSQLDALSGSCRP